MRTYKYMLGDHRIVILRTYLSLACLEGLLALGQLLILPGSGVAGGLFGFSPGRLLLLAPALLLTLAFTWAAWRSWRKPDWAISLAEHLSNVSRQTWVYWGTTGLSGAIFLVCLNFLLLNWKNDDPYVGSYLARMAPFALWALFMSLQTAIAMRYLRFGAKLTVFTAFRKAFFAALITFGVMLLLAGWVARTRFGLAPDLFGWGDPGVPILPHQIVIAFVITLTGAILGSWLLTSLRKSESLHRPWLSPHTIDILVCISLWGIAVWRWGSEPLRPSYFSPAPVPPNQEYYPYSDAAVYDIAAQSLLIGYGLGTEVVRPFYSFTLAISQAFNGIGYQNVLAWQVPLLALIPPLLYLLAKALHNRLSGFLVGLLAVIHESNSIALADIANVSHAKLLMSDLPTTLGIIAACAVILPWMMDPASRRGYPLLAGGILAFTMLVRVQVLILLPFFLVIVWLATRRYGRGLTHLTLLVGGFLCVIVPWLWRNWQVTGKVFLSETSQTSQIGLIGQRYSLSVDPQRGQRFPGEADDAYVSRLARGALDFVQEHPVETARFLTAHFLHNQVATLLVLPASSPLVDFLTEFTNGKILGQDPDTPAVWGRCCSLSAQTRKLGYWSAWDGNIASESKLPVLASLLLVSVGIATAWGRNRVAGLLPLGVNVIYSLSNALVRNSGWRFNLPVDWVGLLYYGVGLIQICLWGWAFLRNKDLIASPGIPEGKIAKTTKSPISWGWIAMGGAAFFLLSAAIPVAERAVPERFQDQDPQALLFRLEAQGLFRPMGVGQQALADFLSQDSAEVLIGRGLYPRYHLAGEGQPGSGWPSYSPRDFNRLGFYLVGPTRRHVVFPTSTAPAYFPNASDVLVLGCHVEEYLDAFMVVFLAFPEKVLVHSPLDQWTCPHLE